MMESDHIPPKVFDTSIWKKVEKDYEDIIKSYGVRVDPVASIVFGLNGSHLEELQKVAREAAKQVWLRLDYEYRNDGFQEEWKEESEEIPHNNM